MLHKCCKTRMCAALVYLSVWQADDKIILLHLSRKSKAKNNSSNDYGALHKSKQIIPFDEFFLVIFTHCVNSTSRYQAKSKHFLQHTVCKSQKMSHLDFDPKIGLCMWLNKDSSYHCLMVT